MKSLGENDTYTLTTLPEGKSLVGGRWVYAVKEGQRQEKLQSTFCSEGLLPNP